LFPSSTFGRFFTSRGVPVPRASRRFARDFLSGISITPSSAHAVDCAFDQLRPSSSRAAGRHDRQLRAPSFYPRAWRCSDYRIRMRLDAYVPRPSLLPCLASGAFRRFGSLATPFLGFLDTDDSATTKVHRARRQSGLLQLIEVRDTNADRPAEFPD
jgi:hypothetical protein